ncbi:hypothetical protein B0H15DRAFT_851300 [Mycena belliarum]|uniref:Uncharacterized protein n=1 Tax=Mycena belliarum TaxID=1033014 RepID=A0AAD6TYU5_9AGAR|nr:hypothetical protein B0H15DRAFT_851300 [Mycena belliae]
MPLLMPAMPPPTSQTSQDIAQPGSNAQNNVVGPSVPPTEPLREQASTVSRVPLPVDAISAELASELAAALIGHVLFLKNQVPFPVVQLYRIPSGKSTPRALKLRTDLLAAFDTLSSHLNTTFSALSTAFALTAGADGESRKLTRRAYLAILVGPSIGSAKTRIMFAVDGLVAKVWGERDDLSDDDANSSEDEEDDGSEDEDQGSGPSDVDSSTGSDEDASSPPPSRSPSPSPCSSPPPAPRAHSPPNAPVSPHAQTQQTLRAATRLLSHTLATAPHSLAAELGTVPPFSPTAPLKSICTAPAQTHVLVRAPRRFAHPAWIPRQGVSATLDAALREFRAEAEAEAGVPGASSAQDKSKSKAAARAKARKVEGVWVTCGSPGVEFAEEAAEEDEMIWWSWDGKIVGFADW